MSIVVIGNFDGVHKGHQQILNRAKALAGDEKIVALTFDPHPVSIFAPERAPSLLTILSDKIELLKIHNADQVAVIKFTKEFAAMSPEDFVNKVLIDQLKASTVIVGSNFTYGRPHRLDGIVVHGEKRGREIGYPTANLGNIDGQTIPADGVYAGWLTVGIDRWPAAISIGTNPTFEGVRGRQVEAYALDQVDLDLYTKSATIEFGWRLRDTLKFDGLEPLLEQMAKDCQEARRLTEL